MSLNQIACLPTPCPSLECRHQRPDDSSVCGPMKWKILRKNVVFERARGLETPHPLSIYNSFLIHSLGNGYLISTSPVISKKKLCSLLRLPSDRACVLLLLEDLIAEDRTAQRHAQADGMSGRKLRLAQRLRSGSPFGATAAVRLQKRSSSVFKGNKVKKNMCS